MAIILRNNKGSELTHAEMDTNLGSFYYSSSLAGGNLTLFTTGSISHSINLGSATGAQGAPGTNGAQGAPGNNGNNGAQGAEGAQGAPGNVAAQGAQGAPGNNGAQGAPGNNGNNGAQGAPGAGGTPGGSDTQVQFNDGGSAFGGDSGFTYNKTTNRVTITATGSATRTAPNLLLNSELASVVTGEVLGVIAANNTTDPFSPASYPASIQFVADTNFAPGTYDTSIRLYTNDGATEKEALRLVNTGQNRIPQYGSGTFTGTAAYNLSVDTSGNVIETGVVQAGQTFTRPTSATSVVYNIHISSTGNGFIFSSVTNGNPTTNGRISTDSATASSVTTIKINKLGSTGTTWTTQLLGLAPSSSFELAPVGGGTGTGIYRIVQSIDQSSYVEFNVANVGTPTGTYTVGDTVTVETTTSSGNDVYYEYFLSSSYNRLAITNNGYSDDSIRFKANRNFTIPGNKVIVEASIGGGSYNVPFTYQARSGSVSAAGQVNKTLFNIGASSAAAAVLLDNNDVLVAEFLCWGTGSEASFGLVPSTVMQVFNN